MRLDLGIELVIALVDLNRRRQLTWRQLVLVTPHIARINLARLTFAKLESLAHSLDTFWAR